MSNNAVLIMPYFGRLPSYFGTYLKSLEGKNMDVLWISDIEVPRHPDNFKIVRMTFDDVRALFQKTLCTEVVINGGRRLCDFRPMYAKVFGEYIKEYEYWGWGDCDLVYGRKFNEFLEKTITTGKYDAVSMHKAYMSGPTCFYRNTPQMCELYLKTGNWRDVCAESGTVILNYDECGGLYHGRLSSGEMTMEACAVIRDSFPAALWREPGMKIYRQDEINEESLAGGEVVSMKDGCLSIDGREIFVFHFVQAKVPRWFRLGNVPYEKVRDYWIDATGFYHSGFAWRTRWLRRPARKGMAAVEAIGKHGVGHVLKRLIH